MALNSYHIPAASRPGRIKPTIVGARREQTQVDDLGDLGSRSRTIGAEGVVVARELLGGSLREEGLRLGPVGETSQYHG